VEVQPGTFRSAPEDTGWGYRRDPKTSSNLVRAHSIPSDWRIIANLNLWDPPSPVDVQRIHPGIFHVYHTQETSERLDDLVLTVTWMDTYKVHVRGPTRTLGSHTRRKRRLPPIDLDDAPRHSPSSTHAGRTKNWEPGDISYTMWARVPLSAIRRTLLYSR
jgi:hypothetical protein